MTPTQKDLIDTDGENRAVRAFLLGREVGCKDYEQMRRHMTNSGFNNCWPSEFAGLGGHMSKGDQQMWLRHLFALERLGALAEQPAEQKPVAWIDGSDLSLMMRYGRGCIAWGTEQNNAKTPLYTAPQPAIPPGYKLVPVEPTEEMCNPSGDKGPVADMSAGYRKEIWKSMLAAAPEAPQPAKRRQLTEDEWFEFWDNCQAIPSDSSFPEFLQIARAIEAAHGIGGGI